MASVKTVGAGCGELGRTQSTGGGATWQSLTSKTVTPIGTDLAALAFAVKDSSRLLITSNDVCKNPCSGNHAGQPISATIAVSGVTGTFTYGGEPSCGGTTANARLFFESRGKFAYTNYWWSNRAYRIIHNNVACDVRTSYLRVSYTRYGGYAGVTRTGC